MNRINLSLIFHFHQPVGNFPEIFKMATEKAYKPLLQALKNFPQIPFALHISGPLWEYFDENNPEMFELIRELSERGQLELLGGGFYEPVLSVIPERDAREQLEWMSDFLEGQFLKRPTGIWLAERIWEPHMPELLHNSGLRYTTVDDYHFKSVGITDEDLMGYYYTEHVGKKVAIFPISEKLRYLMPFSPPEDTISYLAQNASLSGKRLMVFGDDGEKFGLWPETHEAVWDNRWFERFLGLLMENEWIVLKTPQQAMDDLKPKGNVYLPTGSYFEMGEWTLPPNLGRKFSSIVSELKEKDMFESWQPFIRGGFWRNFLHKYNESSWMHKRMLFTSKRLHREVFMMNENIQETAERALYRSQCNCAYWHGIFGGLHMPHLRRGIWDNIIHTEHLLGKPKNLPIREDIDCDGNEEILIASKDIQVWVKPSLGGLIEELSLPAYAVNLTDTLARREEIYHKSAQDCEISEHFVPKSKEAADVDEADAIENNTGDQIPMFKYDTYPRRMSIEHFLPLDTTFDAFKAGNAVPLATFYNKAFSVEKIAGQEIELAAQDMVGQGNDLSLMSLRKHIVISEEEQNLSISYTIENHGEPRKFVFAVESNFGLQSPDDPNRYLVFPGSTLRKIAPGSQNQFVKPGDFEIRDKERNLRIHARTRAESLWLMPIHTIAKSQNDYLKIYQATTIVQLYKVDLGENQRFTCKISYWFQPLSEQGKDIAYPGLFDY